MNDAAIFAGLFLSTALYALFLNIQFGKWMRQELTFLTVIIGVGIILLWMALVDMAFALRVGAFFAVGGFPIMAESLYRLYKHWQASTAHQLGGTDEQR